MLDLARHLRPDGVLDLTGVRFEAADLDAVPTLPGVRNVLVDADPSSRPGALERLARLPAPLEVGAVRVPDASLPALSPLGDRLVELEVHATDGPWSPEALDALGRATRLRRLAMTG